MGLRKSQFLKVAYFIPFIQHYQSDKMAGMEHRAVVFQISGTENRDVAVTMKEQHTEFYISAVVMVK